MPEIICSQAKREFKTLSQIAERLSKKDIFMCLHKGQVRFRDNSKIIPESEIIQETKLLQEICPCVLHEYLRVDKLALNSDG